MTEHKDVNSADDELYRLWLEVADEVGNDVAPKQEGGSPERGIYLATQGIMYAKLRPRLDVLIKQGVLAARIDELGHVQLEYGHRVAQTFVDGQAMTIPERLEQLNKAGEGAS